MRQTINHGQNKPFSHPRLDINGRLDSLQAAVLLAKLGYFPAEVARRVDIGKRYSHPLHTIPVCSAPRFRASLPPTVRRVELASTPNTRGRLATVIRCNSA